METGDIVALAFLAGIALWFIRAILMGRPPVRWTLDLATARTRATRCGGERGDGRRRAAPVAPATRRRARAAAWRDSISSAGGAPRGRARDRARPAARAWRRPARTPGAGSRP